MNLRGQESGFILFVALLFCVIVSVIMVTLLNMSYQKSRQIYDVGVELTKDMYKTQAGTVDASWRIRTNSRPNWVGGAANNFGNNNFTLTYFMDIDTDTITPAAVPGVSDIRVDIGARNIVPASPQYRLRSIRVRSLT